MKDFGTHWKRREIRELEKIGDGFEMIWLKNILAPARFGFQERNLQIIHHFSNFTSKVLRLG